MIYTKDYVLMMMHACHQNEKQTIAEHGEAVAKKFMELYNHLKYGNEISNWRLPEWIKPELLDYLLPLDILQKYQAWHDCGKPFCKTIDENGKQHFPNHAKVSENIWMAIDGNIQIGQLISMDMDVHLLKSEQVEEFSNRPEAISLLLTGLAELHANADMFGGIESVGFKIKWKHINKIGKRILTRMNIS